MQTPVFARAIERLMAKAKRDRLALMCAEAVPWRCHRSLIADALLVRGIPSEDITSATRRLVHVLTPFAKVDGMRITYPPEPAPPAPTKPFARRTSRTMKAKAKAPRRVGRPKSPRVARAIRSRPA